MIMIACVDDRLGMMFHHRRQSQDRVLRDRILDLTIDNTLWMSSYSAKLFADQRHPGIKVEDNYLALAGTGHYCLTEDVDPFPYAAKIEKIILYHWNCRYPADQYFMIPVKEQWRLVAREDFAGSSHKKITEEVYIR